MIQHQIQHLLQPIILHFNQYTSTITAYPTTAPNSIDGIAIMFAHNEWWFWPVMTSVGFVFIILISGFILIVLYCKKSTKMKKIMKNMDSKSTTLKNPMCVLLGIGKYEECPENADFKGYVNNLAVDIDIKNLLSLFKDKLKYDVFPKYDIINKPKIDWTQAEIINLLQHQAEIFSANVESNEDNNNDNKINFDGLIVVVSGHGMKNKLITSD
eukprot:434412_1